jgi:hypothetical protein
MVYQDGDPRRCGLSIDRTRHDGVLIQGGGSRTLTTLRVFDLVSYGRCGCSRCWSSVRLVLL